MSKIPHTPKNGSAGFSHDTRPANGTGRTALESGTASRSGTTSQRAALRHERHCIHERLCIRATRRHERHCIRRDGVILSRWFRDSFALVSVENQGGSRSSTERIRARDAGVNAESISSSRFSRRVNPGSAGVNPAGATATSAARCIAARASPWHRARVSTCVSTSGRPGRFRSDHHQTVQLLSPAPHRSAGPRPVG